MSEIKILIVEDEAIVSLEIEDTLKELGYIVTGAVYSGEEAIEKINQSRPDVVLLDIKLDKGQMDGIETAREIRYRYNIPFIYVTAYTDEETVKRAKLTYPYGYVHKPFKKKELQTTIELALSKHKAETQLQKSHEKLEIRVIERTSELVKLQERLLQEKRERRLSEESLALVEKELDYLSTHLLIIQENERKRIAKQLCDGIGEPLATMQEHIEQEMKKVLSPPPLQELLASTVLMIQKAVKDIQKMAIHLDPSHFKNGGFIKIINQLCDEYQQNYPSIKIKKNIFVKEIDISEHMKTVMHRILYQAMSNVVLHSEADWMCIELEKAEQKMELVIKDNGRGLAPEGSSHTNYFLRGSGFSIMREMTELSGGWLVIESLEGGGTTVRASWNTQ